jgi:nucleoside-diphosphate-sugar epimerase
MSVYLVTGGAGFIGSHLAEELLRRGHTVRVVDSLITGRRQNLEMLKGIDFLEGDLADPAVARRAVQGMEYVLHQAAIPSVPRSVEFPLESHESNATGSLRLLRCAADAGVRRLVYASSSSVYGASPTLPKVESMATEPLSPYAVSKLSAEQYAVVFHRLYGLETVSLRYFNVFGPRQDPNSPYSGVVSRFIDAIVTGVPPTIHGDGEQTRDFTFVKDAVAATMAAGDRGVPGRAYNIGGGSRVSMNQVIDIIGRVHGKALDVRRQESQKGDMRDTYADTTLARADIGFKPSVSLEEGIEAEYRWLSTTPAVA